MRRSAILASFVLQLSLAWPSSSALAAQPVRLETDRDATLVVVGDGLRPGQQLVVRLGSQRYLAFVDSSGGFEVSTGLSVYQGAVVVHRADALDLGLAPLLLSDQADAPNPLAVLFAQSLASGAALLGCVAGVLAVAMMAVGSPRRGC